MRMRTAKTSHGHRDGLDYRLKLTGNSQEFTGARVERWHYRPFEVPPVFGQIGLKVSSSAWKIVVLCKAGRFPLLS